jgi:hypothetical protein
MSHEHAFVDFPVPLQTWTWHHSPLSVLTAAFPDYDVRQHGPVKAFSAIDQK